MANSGGKWAAAGDLRPLAFETLPSSETAFCHVSTFQVKPVTLNVVGQGFTGPVAQNQHFQPPDRN